MSESYLGFMVGDKVKITDKDFRYWLQYDYEDCGGNYEVYNEHRDNYMEIDFSDYLIDHVDDTFTISKLDEDDIELDILLEARNGKTMWINSALIGRAELSILEKAVDL
mgnify:CR=1 FL=1